MRKIIWLTGFLALMITGNTGFAQTYKAGDRAEALINNVWQEVTIVNAVAGKPKTFAVKTISGNTPVLEIAQKTIRPLQVSTVKGPVSAMKVQTPENVHLGKYELFSGIPSVYIGHIYLLEDGKYKVAFGTDEDNYEIGKYSYNNATNSLQWETGLFKNKGWTGKLVNTSGKGYRIEFNKVTFAETN